MSLEVAARHLASKGRGPDTELIHMTKGEIAGLQQLAMAHGGSLTINPETGLVEAGFLSSILPTLVGGIATMFGGPMAGAAAGALVGGASNKKNPLMGALMGGLGGYGAAGLVEGIGGLGADAAAQAATATQQAATAAGAAGGMSTAAPAATNVLGTAAPEMSMAAMPQGAAQEAIKQSLVQPAVQATPWKDMAAAQRFDATKSGLSQLFENPMEAFPKLVGSAADKKAGTDASGLGGGMQALKTTGMAFAPLISYAMTPEEKAKKEAERARYEFDAGYTGGTFGAGAPATSEATWFNPRFTRQYASGGDVQGYPMSNAPQSAYSVPSQQAMSTNVLRRQGNYSNADMFTGEEKFAAGGGLQEGGFVIPADVVSALGNGSSSAGLEHLSKKLGAKPIQGPGDGMSDSIKTHINGKQRAAVARDEAYMGPKEVARVGGPKKLYAMMDKVRKNAHGKTTQQRKVNPNSLV